MILPLPGAGVFYSVLKDVWSWVSNWSRGRRLAPEVLRGWTVNGWYHPYQAIEKFGDYEWLRQIEDEDWPRRLDRVSE